MDEYIQLLEDLAAFHNRALALGINLEKFTDDASRIIDAALDEKFAAELANIKAAFRRPSSGAVN